MPPAAGRAFEHHQPDLILLAQDQLLVGCRPLLIVTIDIMKEETADVLTACQSPIDGSYTVGTVPIVYLNICDCHKVSSDPGDTKENNNK